MFDPILKWRTENIRGGDGVIAGADISQEWILPWWWKHYSEHNSHPVAWIDFGMSKRAKEWCQKRGELIPLRMHGDFIAEEGKIEGTTKADWEESSGTHFWPLRNVWFKKPFALLQTPFERTVWIDIDCEVLGKIGPLFPFADGPAKLGMHEDRTFSKKGEDPMYNSGVISFLRQNPLILDWAKECIDKNDQFVGDQEVFSNLIARRKIAIGKIPSQYNWGRMRDGRDGTVIYHWHGNHGKQVIRAQMLQEEICF